MQVASPKSSKLLDELNAYLRSRIPGFEDYEPTADGMALVAQVPGRDGIRRTACLYGSEHDMRISIPEQLIHIAFATASLGHIELEYCPCCGSFS